MSLFLFITVVQAIVAAALVGVILMQRSEGGGLGVGGSPSGLMSARGAADFLSRATAILATAFFLASVGLAVMAKHKAEGLREGVIPVPAATESREAPQLPGDLPVPASGAAAPDVPVAPGTEANGQAPEAAMQQIPAPEAGNQAAQDVPSRPSEQPATEQAP